MGDLTQQQLAQQELARREILRRKLSNVPDFEQQIGSTSWNAAKQLPRGIMEGLQTGYAGLTGGQFKPQEVPDESGAGFGRGAGQMIGQGITAAPFAIGGGLVGGPFGAVLGAGAGAAATTPGDAVDRGIAGLATMAVPVAGKVLIGAGKKAIATPGQIKSLFEKVDTRKALNEAHKVHDKLQSTAGELFNHVRDKMKEGDIKISPSTGFMEQIKSYIPKRSTEHNKMFTEAEQGNPEAIHNLQSWLWKKGTKAVGSDDPAISNKGDEMLSLRTEFNDDVRNKLTQAGHIDLAHMYKQGQNLFKELKDKYYGYNKIANVFNPEIRKIPTDIAKHFSEESTPMNKFFETHPKLKEEVQKSLKKDEAFKELKKYGSYTAGTATGLGLKSIYDIMGRN